MTINIDQIIKIILEHENLFPGQTPFRITNPQMKKWDTILGFKINKNPQSPENRKNFLYLVNPNEVPLAVKKQFERYSNTPVKYGLQSIPTLKDAISVFDQSNVNGKINYLISKIPDLDINLPLKNFII